MIKERLFWCLFLSVGLVPLEALEQRSDQGLRHALLICGNKTLLIDENNRILYDAKEASRDGVVLDNGHILYSTGKEVKEVTSNGELVWKQALSPENAKGELGTVQRLDNGGTLYVERGPVPQLVELHPDYSLSHKIPLQPETDNVHMQTRAARKNSKGHYWVAHLLAYKVKCYDKNGVVLKSISTDLPELGGREHKNWPFTAIELENGNLLCNLTHGNKTVEFDLNNSVVWQASNSDLQSPLFKDPCGGQRLPNGNTIICSYGNKKPGVKIFELTPDKKVVWELYDDSIIAHGVHVYRSNGVTFSPRTLK